VRHTRLALSAVSLGIVGLLVALDSESVSPGSLSLVHASETSLQGPDSCGSCHGHLFKSMTSACYDCHEEVEQQVDDAAGFHGQLAGELADDCADCHGEHHGSGFSLVSTRSFLRAGFRERADYDHRGLGYELTGVHTSLQCSACHEHADAQVVPLGSHRFLGLDQRCTTCHEDHHDGAYGTDCASCHGQTQAFAEVGGEGHTVFAPLVGSHADVDCETCHVPESPTSVDALARRLLADDRSIPPRDCASCHVSQHSEGFLSGVAAAAGRLADGRTCRHCHEPEDAGFLGREAGMPRELHAASGFALELPHDAVDCLPCHQGFDEREPLDDLPAEAAAFAAAFPGRDADTCSACHMDAHRGQFESGPFAAEGCLGCHARTSFAPTEFGLEHHARTAFPLEGSHAAARCEDCHELPEGQPRLTDEGFVTREFAGTSVTCSGCHESPHGAEFVAGVTALLPRDTGESCAACHDARHESFLGDTGTMDERLHAASGFALVPPHDEAACADCHAGLGVRLAEPATEARRLEFAAAFPGREALDCESCHDDPHSEQFAGGVFAGEDCLGCHDSHAFRPPLFDLARHERTDFPLTGGHQAVGCNECHLVPEGAPALTADKLLTRVFTGTDPHCVSCHEDVHGGLFDRQGLPRLVGGRDGCARCHTTEDFALRHEQGFDHALWAGYPLLGAHASAACGDCHLLERTADPPRLYFGTVRGTECSGCHEDSHVGQFAIEGVTDCERCHQPALQFADLVFDHQRDSRFALDEVHEPLECSACHKPVDVGGRSAVRYKPLGVDCADCHDPAGLQLQGRGAR